jgi:hypothetical protein
MRLGLCLLLLVYPHAAGAAASEAELRALLARSRSGTVRLPGGVIEIGGELRVAAGSRGLTIEGDPAGSTMLRARPDFVGRAVLTSAGATNLTFRNFTIDGNRLALERTVDLGTREAPFSEVWNSGGIVIEKSRGLTISNVRFQAIANYAVIVSACSGVTIEKVQVLNSGSRNARGRNNASGGILLEEGVSGFAVRDSRFRNVRGNAVWTHSWSRSPRNRDGVIERNTFDTIARDAIQVGHAVNVRVENNSGRRIGYPTFEVDIENGATPAAIDTSGNVESSNYTANRFEEVNGKCIDLDGYHDGAVTNNTCVNRGRAEDYPSGHFGIVVNNWNPEMESANITIAGNVIDGSKFGGLFLIGRDHRVERNRLVNLNLAHCNEAAAQFGCVAIAGEPRVLEAGIYLGRIAAEWAQKRADASRGHVITGNTIGGFKMRERCILAAPGVAASASRIESNRCEDTSQ